MDRIPTAPIAAASLTLGYAVASASGSRPLGGAVLLAGGTVCALLWTRRAGARTALALSAVELGAFAGSHVLALAIGAWPSVALASLAAGAAAWTWADAPADRRRPLPRQAGRA